MTYETRKLHISVPIEVYEYIRNEKLFKEIDGIVTDLLIKKYNINI